ncbi:shikimate kinase [Microterricola gilva]|uniref:Shikimate kinase n=1 Tax=Microterricola gilva TaxID=393267 RepID=A0A4Q8AKT2_9MICO|nr:shikimate kinase [Microterricola gilva]RZU65018.1 shikimate kinase [Microterricola gilva]
MKSLLPLVFIGPMAAGKSKIGRLVARRLSVPFIDTDKVIAAKHGPIPAIFAAQGEPAFRAYERDAVAEAMRGDAVVSLGGGAVLHPDTRLELAGHTVVLLTVTRDAVAKRLAGSGRPLLDGDDAVERWAAIADTRMPIYEALATETFDTSARPITQIADDIVTWARERS